MKLQSILVLLYIIIIVIVIVVLYSMTNERNYWRRALPIQKCPFGKEAYEAVEILGDDHHYSEGIISYSLFGNYEKYAKNLLLSLEAIPHLLPTWHPRVYVGVDIPRYTLDKLLAKGAEVYIMGPNATIGFEAALWRFHPAGEMLPFVSLDADDVFDEKIRDEIERWIASGQPFGNFSKHGYMVPLAAGLWGARPIDNQPPIPDIQDDINSYCEHWFGFDEAYLKNKVWPLFKKHGYYQCSNYHLTEITIALLIVLIIIMVYTVYRAGEK